MKNILVLAIAATASVAAFAGMNNVVISFSTPGPDKYSDGTTVLDGERYALVWTPSGEEFAGINANGEAAGGSKVVISAPVATGGHCPKVLFQVDEDYVSKNYPNGTWSVCLLDTRVFALEDNGQPKVENGQRVVQSYGADKFANGYGVIGSAVATKGGNVDTAGGVAAASDTPSADTPAPVVKDIKVDGGYVYVTITATKPAFSYSLAAGDAPNTIAPSASDPKDYGSATDDIILVKPAKAGGEFFKVNCR